MGLFPSLGSMEEGMGTAGTVTHSQFCPRRGHPRILEVGGTGCVVGSME